MAGRTWADAEFATGIVAAAGTAAAGAAAAGGTGVAAGAVADAVTGSGAGLEAAAWAPVLWPRPIAAAGIAPRVGATPPLAGAACAAGLVPVIEASCSAPIGVLGTPAAIWASNRAMRSARASSVKSDSGRASLVRAISRTKRGSEALRISRAASSRTVNARARRSALPNRRASSTSAATSSGVPSNSSVLGPAIAAV